MASACSWAPRAPVRPKTLKPANSSAGASAPPDEDVNRRHLLQLLASSSLLPHLHLPVGWVDAAYAQSPASPADSDLILSAADALSVLDFEPVAKAKLPPWHWAWLSTGGDGSETMRANREGYDRYQIRARRLVDISKVDTSIQLFGRSWETPIYMSPVGGHRTYNPEGELA